MAPNIPNILKREEFRFYRVLSNKKLPFGKKWNTENALKYNDYDLKSWTGNYGVIGGFGNLIIIDFDSQEYYDKMKDKLPPTFTVITASKRLPHLYYIVQGEMIRKKPIKGLYLKDGLLISLDHNYIEILRKTMAPAKFQAKYNLNTVCDIQAAGAGVVGPNSSINRRFYEPNNTSIATISIDKIKTIFGLNKELETYTEFKPKKLKNNKESSWKVYKAYAALTLGGVNTCDGNMQCPFHEMKGSGNLSVTDQGKIYCFDCLDNLWADQFLVKKLDKPYRYVNKLLKMVKILWQEQIKINVK